MMAQAGVNPAEAGVVAERFSAQARFLETTVIQQLQEKKAIEFLHGQLMATRALVNSLEQHHDLQSQQIEANLQKALAVYEQAIALRAPAEPPAECHQHAAPRQVGCERRPASPPSTTRPPARRRRTRPT